MGIFSVIGPVMVGPSSSHTAGAVRLGLFARYLFGGEPDKVFVGLHGSFAATGQGHGTPLAILAGIMGLYPDDERIRKANKLAQDKEISVDFFAVDLGETHPNSVLVRLIEYSEKGEPENEVEVAGSSIGGGEVLIWRFNQFSVELNGKCPTFLLICPDHPGVIAEVSALLADYYLNIAQMKVYRKRRGGEALMTLELDETPNLEIINQLSALSFITTIRFIPALCY